MAGEPGRYVFVVDKMAMAKTRRAELLERAERLGLTLHIEVIISDDDLKGDWSVGRRIQEAGADLSGNQHVVVIVTHAGMTRCRDWRGYALWDAIIVDEVPSVLEREDHAGGRFNAHALSGFYGLAPTEVPGISTVTLTDDLTLNEVPEDWRAFHRRIARGETLCNISAWSDLTDVASWFSWRMWNVREALDGVFGEIVFLADAFDQSETFHLMSLDRQVHFKRFRVATARAWAPRPVTIRYVSEERRAASSRFKSEDHAADMAKVWDWLALETDPFHLWTANAGVTGTAEIAGKRVTPKQAGSNEWMAWHKASAIYAAKPSPNERRFYAILGIEADVIVASREAYDLNQFFMRTSLRDPTSTAPVELRCFDRTQAETFAAKLAEAYGLDAELVHDDIALDLSEIRKGGRPPKNGRTRQTPEERRTADAARKKRQRQAKKKAA
uniref:Uncharacterized protein n=1 Tax=viral metagenome TaxID=1070528 RepID=A0A6M3XKP1_9ZZZZ